jgi:hypothetical protein
MEPAVFFSSLLTVFLANVIRSKRPFLLLKKKGSSSREKLFYFEGLVVTIPIRRQHSLKSAWPKDGNGGLWPRFARRQKKFLIT